MSSSSSNVKLFGTPFSTCSQRVLLTANELGITLDLNVVDLSKGEHKQPAHMARQPFGKVPALQDGSFELYESRAMVHYLVRKYGASSGLIPTDVETLARYDQWSSLEATTINPEIINICVQRVWGAYRPGFVFSQSALDAAVAALQTPLDVLEKHLSSNQYLAGNTYTALDIIFTPYTAVVFDGTEEGKKFLSTRPHLAAYWKRITDRPAWQKVKALLKH